MIPTIELLSLMHDARLLEVEVDFSTGIRRLTFTARYNEDCGLPSYSGKTVKLTAEDIALMRSMVHGAIMNPEQIDSCDLTVSKDMEIQFNQYTQNGSRDAKARLSVKTHSGSIWEILCESLSLEIMENRT